MNSYLLYCIFRSSENQVAKNLPGLDGRPLVMVSHNGLSAAVSQTTHPDPAPDVARIMTYQKIIEAFHHDRTIIPMRYGCLLPTRAKITAYLGQQSDHYMSLLNELEDCAEMGIRVLMADCEFGAADFNKKSKQYPVASTPYPASGKNYLTARKAHYAQEDQFSKESERIVERIRVAFAGLYLQFKSECAGAGQKPPASGIHIAHSAFRNYLSFYFLVPKKSVESFRQTFRHVSCNESLKLLLSGPWPPYNFVIPDRQKELTYENKQS